MTVKLNNNFRVGNDIKMQLTGIYIAPENIPQGREGHRFSLDFGIHKDIQNRKGEIFFNANDLLATMVPKTTVNGESFSYTSKYYGETQVFRIGYSYKF